jgi:hypothetical protein
VWVVDKYAVIHSRTYLFTYVVLLDAAISQDGKNMIVFRNSSVYRPASRLFCNYCLPATPWLVSRAIKGDGKSVFIWHVRIYQM